MLVAVISDVHSNAYALDAVLDSIDGYERLLVLGDIVGYGPHPDAVVERLREEAAVAVQGNHDAAAVGRIPTSAFNDMARAAIEWTAEAMAPATREWLRALPETRVEQDLTLVHGSPREPLWEYLGSASLARLNLAAFETTHCLVGHTHLPLTFRQAGSRMEALPAEDGARLRLDERRCILNPGSVGQPRDGDPRACAMLIDTDAGEVQWRRIDYPVERTQEALFGLPLPESLALRLELGF